MLNGPSAILSSDEIASIARDAVAEGRAGRTQAASKTIQPLRRAQRHQLEAARGLLWIIDERSLAREEAADILLEIADAYDDHAAILSGLGLCLEAVRDIDNLNAAAPVHPIFQTTLEKLDRLARRYEGKAEQEEILRGLATAARMMARQRDKVAEDSLRKLTEINSHKSAHHYNLGLFYKTRGRFAEGVRANRAATNLSQEVIDSYEWNLGICATGAGDAEIALDVWKRMGQKIELGRFGLPEGGYSGCKVRLCERPLAERTADRDDPGDEETVWIERLSPCHGIVRSVLYRKLGVDYGDVILIDGAPITHHMYGDQQIPVFPHLATLLRRNYRFFDFAGTQQTARQLADMSEELEGDSVIYSHSESFKIMCENCWRNPDVDHADHRTIERHVVIGQIAASPDIAPERLLDLIDQGIARRKDCQIYAPDLCAAAGQLARERIDRRRFALLLDN